MSKQNTTSQTFSITVPAREIGYGDNRRVLPPLLANVEVVVDLGRIAAYLGCKAARSKGKRAIECGGDVVVRVLSMEEDKVAA